VGVEVCVGVWVCVAVGIGVRVGVGVWLGVDVALRLAIRVRVAVRVCVGVALDGAMGVRVGAADAPSVEAGIGDIQVDRDTGVARHAVNNKMLTHTTTPLLESDLLISDLIQRRISPNILPFSEAQLQGGLCAQPQTLHYVKCA